MSITGSDSPTTPKYGERRFSNTLTRTIFILLSIIALLPSIVLATASYFRTRYLLESQTKEQLQNIVQSQALQVQLVAIPGQKAIDDLIVKGGIAEVFEDLRDNPNDHNKRKQALAFLEPYTIAAGRSNYNVFDQLLVVLPDGVILASTNPDWEGINISDVPALSILIGNNHTVTSYRSPFFPDDIVIYSSRTLFNLQGERFATIIGAYKPATIKSLLASSNSYYPNSQAYLITVENEVVGVSASGQQLIPLSANQTHMDHVNTLFANDEGFGSYTSIENTPVLAYGKTIPNQVAKLVLEVPSDIVFGQLQDLTNFGVLLMAVTFTIMAIGMLSLADRFVSPIIELSNMAREFAEGDWSKRATVDRNDELGYLAFSFNRMVDQLTDLYRSLERKVAERTKQLRTASEIAQVATQTSERKEIYNRTVNLMTERFGYNYAAIYSLDAGGTYLTLEDEAGELPEGESRAGMRLGVSHDSIVGWVAANKESRSIRDLRENPFAFTNAIPGSQSEATVPIMLGTQIQAILDIQSKDLEAFDTETLSILASLGDQIASGIQNIILLESTQINLEETSVLYRSSRAITKAESLSEINSQLISTLEQTNYVTGLYSIKDANLFVEDIHDPKYSNVQTTAKGLTLPIKDIIEGLENTSYVIIKDLETSSRFEHILSYYQRRDCKIAAILPIRQMEHLAQFIVLASREQDDISEASLQPFTSLIEVTSSALNRFAVLENLEKHISQLHAITKVSQSISQETNLNILYSILHQHILDIVGADISFGVTLYDQTSEMISVPFFAEGTETTEMPPFPLGEGLSSLVIKKREPIFVQENAEQRSKELGAQLVGVPAKSWLGVPLVVSGEIIGAMILQDTNKENRFEQADLDLMMAIAPLVAIAIRNSQLLSETQSVAQAYDMENFLLEKLLEKTPDHIYFKDIDGKYLRISKALAETIHIQPEKAVGKSDYQLIGREFGAQTQKELDHILETGDQLVGEIEIDHRSGVENWYQKYMFPLYGKSDELLAVLGIRNDISQQKRAEQVAQRRADQLLAASEIARETSQALQLSELLDRAANSIQERFDFYHTAIFLIDRANENAVLMEATGITGEKMKASGHKVPIGSQSLVGQSAYHKMPIVANDVTVEENFSPNTFLPGTLAELSIPMSVGEQIVGVLDVHSSRKNAFMDEDVDILQILTDHLAIAVLNANLFAQSTSNLNLHRIINQTTSEASLSIVISDAIAVAVRNLSGYKPGVRVSTYLIGNDGDLQLSAYAGYGEDQPASTVSANDPLMGACLVNNEPVLVNDTQALDEEANINRSIGRSVIMVPITYASQAIGVVLLEMLEPHGFDQNELEIISALSRNLGSIVNNIRLLVDNRRQIERERQLYEITSRIRRSTDFETILNTSVKEISKVINASRARISLSTTDDESNEELINKQLEEQQPNKNGNNGHGGEELL